MGGFTVCGIGWDGLENMGVDKVYKIWEGLKKLLFGWEGLQDVGLDGRVYKRLYLDGRLYKILDGDGGIYKTLDGDRWVCKIWEGLQNVGSLQNLGGLTKSGSGWKVSQNMGMDERVYKIWDWMGGLNKQDESVYKV